MDETKPTTAWQDYPRRFQFDLKTIFVLVTLAAIWLGFYTLRLRQADAVLARVAAIYGTLAENLAKLPDGTTLIVSTEQRLPQHGFRGATQSRNAVIRAGRFVDSRTAIIDLGLVGQRPQMLQPDTNRILFEHYSRGLEEKGLVRKPNPEAIISMMPNAQNHVEAWYDPHHENLVVTIQASYNTNNSQSTVVLLTRAEIDQPLYFGGKITSALIGSLIFYTGIISRP